MGILGNPTLRLFIGAALISLSPVWVKLVSVSPTTSGFYRVLIGGLALAAYLAFSGQRLQLSRRTWQILLLAAVFLRLTSGSGTGAFITSVPVWRRCSRISRFLS